MPGLQETNPGIELRGAASKGSVMKQNAANHAPRGH